ncbi:MAG TPA: membrane protein insertase YidC, partial [Thermoanaerobaculia bacterium]|nr:membrane protein insertase YidC [Thermoanaerobaculia bacterium]
MVPRTPQRPRSTPEPATVLSPTAASATPGATASAAPAQPLPAAVSARAEETTTLANSVLRVRLSNKGAVIQSVVLLKHTDDEGKPLELVRQIPPPAPRPLSLEFPSDPAATSLAASALYNIEIVSPRAVRMRYADDRLAVTKEFRVGDGYLCDLQVSVVGPAYLLSAGTGLRNPTEQELANRYVMPAVAIVRTPGGSERPPTAKLEKPRTWPLAERGFAGVEDNYFLTALIPQGPSTAQVAPVPTKDPAGKPAVAPAVGISGSGQLSARAYFGPKDVEILESLNLGLEKTVDFGWYGILARPL